MTEIMPKAEYRLLTKFDARALLVGRRSVIYTPLDVFAIKSIDLVARAAQSWSEAGEAQFNWPAVKLFHPGRVLIAVGDPVSARTHAIMQLSNGHKVRCSAGIRGPLTYVSFLEVAPWNRPESAERVFRGLGSLLLQIASQFSSENGGGGVVGLHSLASAEGFYRSLGLVLHDCANEYHELYFELPRARVAQFQKTGRSDQ